MAAWKERLRLLGIGRVCGDGDLVKASVLVPLRQHKGIVEVLLTVRSPHLSTHAGQVALPGGKQEPADADSVDTALREAFEEVGLLRDDCVVLCTLPPLYVRTGLQVTPVVGVIAASFVAVPSEDEVAEVFYVPLSVFLEKEQHAVLAIEHAGTQDEMHEFMHDGHRIWGLTASVLVGCASIALGREPEFPFIYGHGHTRAHKL